jgi:hypothetical protein
VTLRNFPPVPQGVFGVCESCGCVAWELLTEVSTLCLGCDPASYRRDDEDDDPCAHCHCENDSECERA